MIVCAVCSKKHKAPYSSRILVSTKTGEVHHLLEFFVVP